MEQIQSSFGAGNVHLEGSRQLLKFRIQSVKDLKVVQKHLDKYPLITKKRADYELFKQALLLIQNKEHLTIEGLQKIVAIKASLPKIFGRFIS